MTSKGGTGDHVAQTRTEVEAQRAKLARLEADQATAEGQLAALQAEAGDVVLDDPDAAGRLSRQMQELRDRIDITGRAVAAQRSRVAAAESAYLLAEAAVLDKVVAKARGVLERHQAKTEELLRLLEEHEGRFVPESLYLQERARGGPDAVGLSWETPKSEQLQQAVEAAERPVQVLRDLAEGRTPAVPLEDHPACVASPEALVKAPAYLASQRAATERLEWLEARLGELPGLLEDLRGQEAELAAAQPAMTAPKRHPADDPLVKVRRRINGVTAEQERLTTERAQLVGQGR